MTSSHQLPDERDLLDFADAVSAGNNPQPANDLERTFLHVHHAMQGESAAIPSTTKQSTWEDMMSTLALTPEAPVSNRTRRNRAPSAPSFTPKRLRWTPMASAAAAMLVVLASFGIWTATTQNPSTPPPAPRQVAGIAPVPGETLQLATPASKYACDFSQDMPIIPDVNEIPIEGTLLYISNRGSHSENPTGDLMLRCEGEPEDIVLAQDVLGASPLESVPGVIVIHNEAVVESSLSSTQYLNITTGESFVAGQPDPDAMQQTWNESAASPIIIVNDETGKLVVLDTRSMVATPVESLFGPIVPASFMLMHNVSADGETIALALAGQNEDQDFRTLVIGADELGTDGDILLLDTETGDQNWLTIPRDGVGIEHIWLSPDGEKLAAALAGPGSSPGSEYTVTVIATRDGSVLANSEPFTSFDLRTLWMNEGLLIQAGSDLVMLPANGEEQSILYSSESGEPVFGLKPTMDPNVVVVNSTICTGECSLADPETDAGVTSINVSTGETKRFEGVNAAYLDWGPAITLLFMVDPTITYPNPATYTAIDPVSGDVVAEFTDVPGIALVPRQRPIIGAQSISTSESGNVTVVSIGLTNMFELRSDGTSHFARKLPAPGNWAFGGSGWDLTGVVAVAPQGDLLFSAGQEDEGRNRYVLDLTDPNAEWTTIENTVVSSDRGFVSFVHGIPED